MDMHRSIAAPRADTPDHRLTPNDFTAFADNLPEAAWIADATGWIHWYNKRWYEYTGATPEQMEGWGWQAVHDPELLPAVMERWTRSVDTGEPFEMVFPLRGADGVFRPFLTRAICWRDSDGAITHWFGSNTEVTHQEHQRRILATLNETAGQLSSELNIERLVQKVTDAAVSLVGAEFGAFFYNLINAAGEAYTLYTISGVPRENFSKFPQPRNTKVFDPTFRGTIIVRSDDITKDERYGKNAPYYGMPPGHLPVRSYLAVPVVSRSGEVLGGLFFGHKVPGSFTAEHEQLLVGLAAQAAICIDNAKLYERAQREIEERKRAEAARQLLVRELNHRVKNLFSIASGMVSTSARSARSVGEFASALQGRLMALARAHETIYGATAAQGERSELKDLIQTALAPHGLDRLSLEGPSVKVASSAVTALALIFHELSTNAVKYGALSIAAGRITVRWRIEAANLLLDWIEEGGPKIGQTPGQNGFGTQLMQLSSRGTLGGDIRFAWDPSGLRVQLQAALERLDN